jgi:hypothetical protein
VLFLITVSLLKKIRSKLNFFHPKRTISMVVLLVSSLVLVSHAIAGYCPFCSAVAMTFSEQMDTNDVVVVAKLLEIPPPTDDPDADFPRAEFEIVQVIKGEQLVGPEMRFQTQLVGSYPMGQKFLVMGVDPPKIAWTTPMKATDRVFQYLLDVESLPEKGAARLQFFQDFFEDSESILAFDAYDEFARAPYDDLLAMRDQMQHDKLVEWILDPETSVNRRRLYFTMLGVCGTKEDIKMLEELIKSGDRKKRAGLDALIACYLTLAGESGVNLIEEAFLQDSEADYVDALAAVSALRFHGTEVDKIPKSRIVAAVRHLLDRPKMADMIIPDLARWEDWSVMERLVQMFKDADEESNWLRVPVINYLQACPKPEAKAYIEELAKIDPDAVSRAAFFMGGFGDDDEDVDDEDVDDEDVDGQGNSDPGESDNEPLGTPAAQGSLIEKSTSSNVIERNQVSPTKGSDHVVLKIPVESTQQVLLLDSSAEANPPMEDHEPELVETAVLEDSRRRNTPIPVAAGKTQTKLSPIANRDSSVFVSSSAPDTFRASLPLEAVQPLPETLPVASVASPGLTWAIIFVPMGVSVVIFLLLWSVVNGWFERLIF